MTEQEEFEFRLRRERELAAQAPQQNFDPLADMNAGERFLVGMGKAFYDTGVGVKQVYNHVADFVDPLDKPTLSSLVTGNKPLSRVEQSRKEVEERRRLDKPLMDTTAGFLGNVAGNIATTLPLMFVPGANTAKGAALTGGILGALQPTASADEVYQNTAMGAVGGYTGQKIGNFAGRLLGGPSNAAQAAQTSTIGGGKAGASSSVSGSVNMKLRGGGSGFGTVDPTDVGGLTTTQRKIMEKGRQLGFKTTPGQATGSRSLQQMEARMESQPMSSGPFNALKESNQKRLNRIAASALGEADDVVDYGTLGRAHDRISGVYKMVATDKKVPIDPDGFLGRLQQVETEFEGLLPKPLLENGLVKRFFGFAENGEITQRQLQDLASKLGKASHKEMTTQAGDRELGLALYQVKDVIDEMLEGSLSGQSRDLFKSARGQYRNLMLMLRQGVVNPSSGNVSGPTLANVLGRADRGGFMFGRNQSDLYDAARFAQAFRPVVGDSGTATRSLPTNALEWAMSLPLNLASKAYVSSPSVAVTSKMYSGLAPEAFSPEFIRALSAAGGAGGIGLLNSQ